MSKGMILLIEDDEDIIEINSAFLLKEGYEIQATINIKDALESVTKSPPDIILLDVYLPDGTGMDFCSEIRKKKDIPIIFLSSATDEDIKIKGFKVGADDYITKPYSLSELLARIEAILRRTNKQQKEKYAFGKLEIDKRNQKVIFNKKSVFLSPIEYKVLLFLAENAGMPVETFKICKEIWGEHSRDVKKTLNVHIFSIRKKLELDYDSDVRITTIRNLGYQLDWFAANSDEG